MKGHRTVLLASALALVAGLVAGRLGAQTPDPASGAAYSVEDCKTCHEAAVTKYQQTHHAGAASCGTCHGNVAEHLRSNLEDGVPGPVTSFKNLPPADTNKVCLGCHDKGHQANWAGGVHEGRGLACTTCHSVHAFKSDHAQLKTAQDAETCNTCHAQIRSKTMRVSHHPVREGLMSCASCHDPHDSTKPKMVSAESVNEKCLTCHTEKRGPFLWEHAPVRESCLHCHDAHGSNHEKLLVAKQPFLCQRCHLNTRHPGTLYDGVNTVSGPSASNRAVEHACKNCHQNVHGSNGPSGPYLGM